MISMARLLAISPAACPPMPSATMHTVRSGNCLDVDGVLVVLAVVAQQAALADVERERHVADLPAHDRSGRPANRYVTHDMRGDNVSGGEFGTRDVIAFSLQR